MHDSEIILILVIVALGGVVAFLVRVLDTGLLVTLVVAEIPIGVFLHLLTRREQQTPKTEQSQTLVVLPQEEALPPLEKQEWLETNYPRVWDFLKGISVIRTDHDYFQLQDQLVKLIEIQGIKQSYDIESHAREPDIKEDWELLEAQKIAIAILFGKKRVPLKKRW